MAETQAPVGRDQQIYNAIEAMRGDPADPISPLFEKYALEHGYTPSSVSTSYYEFKKKLKDDPQATGRKSLKQLQDEKAAAARERRTKLYDRVVELMAANPGWTALQGMAVAAPEQGMSVSAAKNLYASRKREINGKPHTPGGTYGAKSKAAKASKAEARKGKTDGKTTGTSTEIAVRKPARATVVTSPKESLLHPDVGLSQLLRALADRVEAQDAEHERLKSIVRGMRDQLADL